jgi:hypothetical protein
MYAIINPIRHVHIAYKTYLSLKLLTNTFKWQNIIEEFILLILSNNRRIQNGRSRRFFASNVKT